MNKTILCLFIFLPAFSSFSNEKLDSQRNQQIRILKKKATQDRFKLDKTSSYYYQEAERLKNDGELREAVKNYEYSILMDEDCAECYTSIAEVYYFLGQTTESISYLEIALSKVFKFEFDQVKTRYLLITNYFRSKNETKALKLLKEMVGEYQAYLDKQSFLGYVDKRFQYYAPAFFILSLYYRQQNNMERNLIYFQKALQLGFKKEYINYFFYEFYKKQQQIGIAWEYLKQAKEIDPSIEKNISSVPFMENYDVYSDIIKH